MVLGAGATTSTTVALFSMTLSAMRHNQLPASLLLCSQLSDMILYCHNKRQFQLVLVFLTSQIKTKTAVIKRHQDTKHLLLLLYYYEQKN